MNRVVLSLGPMVIAALIGLIIMGTAFFFMCVYYVCAADARQWSELFLKGDARATSLLLGFLIYLAIVTMPILAFREDPARRFKAMFAFLIPCAIFYFWSNRSIDIGVAVTGLWFVASTTAYHIANRRRWRMLPTSNW